MVDPLVEFASRIEGDFLPAYCRARNYSVAGFKRESLDKVKREDAQNFLRAIDGGLFNRSSDEKFTMPRSSAIELLFTEGWKSKKPRSITLWQEPVITFAAIARLHFDFGWPKELLATQPPSWAFDLSASLPGEGNLEHILGEVKKSTKEIETLLRDLHRLCREHPVEKPPHNDPIHNAYKKWLHLCKSGAQLFWSIGPATSDNVFDVERMAGGRILLREVTLGRLKFSGLV